MDSVGAVVTARLKNVMCLYAAEEICRVAMAVSQPWLSIHVPPL